MTSKTTSPKVIWQASFPPSPSAGTDITMRYHENAHNDFEPSHLKGVFHCTPPPLMENPFQNAKC